jgi:hypothetical protein
MLRSRSQAFEIERGSRGRSHRVAAALGVLVVVLAFGPAAAQEPPRDVAGVAVDTSPAGFVLETITVEGNRRVPAEILIAQSLLVAGRSYSESELRDALHRVRRLPFVLDAELRLDRGSERGRYELVLVIRETSLYFHRADASLGRFESRLELPETIVRSTDEDLVFQELVVGGRFFVGRKGVLFAALDDGLAAGYTRYDLLGSRAFLTIGLRQGSCCTDPRDLDEAAERFDDRFELSVEVGLPLRGNHSLQLGVGRAKSRFETFDLDQESQRYFLEGRWVFDSTDDPILPSSGARHSAGVAIARGDQDQPVFLDPQFPVVVALDSRYTAGFGEAIWYLPLGRRRTLGLGVDAGWSRNSRSPEFGGVIDGGSSDQTFELVYGGVEVSYAHRLWERRGLGRYQALRWESSAEYVRQDLDVSTPGSLFAGHDQRFDLRSSLVYRSRLGVVRLGLSYTEARSR